MSQKNLNQLHHDIVKSIYNVDPVFSYDDIHQKVIDLCNIISEEEETEWMHSELDVSLDSLIVGAFWHYTEWHRGQHDITYAALSQLGTIFSPGMTAGCDEDSPEEEVYQLLEQFAA